MGQPTVTLRPATGADVTPLAEVLASGAWLPPGRRRRQPRWPA